MLEIDIPGAMEKAADYITEKPEHFGKGRFWVAEGCHCTLGAYALGLGAVFVDGIMEFGSEDDHEAWRKRTEAFDAGWLALTAAVEPLGFEAVQEMNDAPETTADQMANVLRETAARLRAQSDA